MALSTCKVCQKAICLMCVHEEKDGTFCSEACIGNLREVNDWVGTGSPPAARPQSMAAAVETPRPTSSVFEEMPDSAPQVSHPDPVAIPEELPPAEEPPAEAPAPSTSSIGNPCYAHPDIRAKAFCRRCRKPICGLCIVENAAGMFCSDACVSQSRSRKAGLGTKLAVTVVVLLVAGAAVYAVKPELFKGLMGGAAPEKKKSEKPIKPEPPKPPSIKPELPKPPPIKPEPPKPPPIKPEPPKPPLTNPNPEPVRPLPPKPPPPKPTIMVHPWQSDEPGSWYRVRRGDRVEDVGLKQRDAVSYTVATQAWNKDQAEAGAEKTVEVEPIELLGEEPVEVEGRSYLCQVRRLGDRQEWTLVTGRHAGAVLRMTAPNASNDAVRLWEHTVRVKDRDFDCLVVEARQADGNILKTWYCPSYPLKTVRVEREGVLLEALVDWGGSWASRKAPK